jgi:hypothetical protein
MINKIKDFLKNKLARRRSHDLSDQDESQHDEDNSYNDQLPEGTGEYHLSSDDLHEGYAPSFKERLKEKLQAPLAALMIKIRNANSRVDFKKSTLKKSAPAPGPRLNGPKLLAPSLGQGIEKFLNRSSREPIHQFFLVFIIGAGTYSLGKVTALALKGRPDLVTVREQSIALPLERDFNPATLNQVKRINIFRTNTGLTTKKKVADARCENPQQASSLPIKLVNTVVLQDNIKSIASVQVRGDRSLQEVRVGDQISNLAKIFKINRLAILVRNLENGMCESISSDKLLDSRRSPISVMSPAASREYKLNKKMPGIENVGNKFSISKSLINDKMKDIASILTQARAIKIQNPDGTISFKLTEMDPEGIFPYLGLQDQDIITSINGKPIYDMNEVMSLFGRIKNLENLSLGVRREGSEAVQEYSIKK